MKRIRIVGLCLMAVFAFSAIAVSSASASEILFEFTKGNIAEGGTFTSKGETSSKLQTLGGSTVTCTQVRDTGSFLSAHLGLALILFLGCTTIIFGGTHTCTTSGQPSGHIHLLNLVFHLGLAHLGSNTTIPAIIILLPSAGVEFNCEVGNVKVTGNVIGALQKTNGEQAPINTPEKEVNLVYKLKSTGMQELTEILMSLNGGALTTAHLTTEDLLETKESGQESSDTLEGFKNSKGEETEIKLVEG
jgi:hypothetical protein